MEPEENAETSQETKFLHRLFERQARLTPDSLAVADEKNRLTYHDLDLKAERLASRLRESGTGPDRAVGIYMERCAEYVVSMLAALKAGGAFLPLELAYPRSMLEEISAESSPTVVLTKERFQESLPSRCQTISLDEDREIGPEDPEKRKSLEIPTHSTDNLAFIAYSSGTTGKPKGIANSHRAAVESYLWRAGISAPGKLVGCNVFFVWEVLRPLLHGGASYVIPDDIIYSPTTLVELLAKRRVTETLVTPSLLESILNNAGDDLSGKLPDLETLWLNGEVVTKKLAGRAIKALPETRLLNVYSISEAHEVAAGDLRELLRELREDPNSTHCPVGAPMNPSQTYVLDEELRRVPEAEDGELYVGGDCLARGYVNLPQKTAERFIESPFSVGERLYRTGDRARLLPDGRLEILGRCDFMVKVRGYSIELGAVETAIEKALPVESCAVVADGEEGEDKRLVAYLVPGAEWEKTDVDPKTGRSPEIRRALKDSLPHYAIPATFVVADSLPLQETTGKVDRKDLPPPPERATREAASIEELKLFAGASQEEREETIKRVWESVLRLDEGDVEREDDFFEIGGHSLAAAETLAALEEIFGVRIPVGALLEEPTVAALQRGVSTLQKDGDQESPELIERSPKRDQRRDAFLENDISPVFSDSPTTFSASRRVFLTGATGFLGAFLLDGILRETGAEVYCLARRKPGSSPLSSIRRNLESYGIWRAGYAERIIPLVGDLSEPRLGLDAETFERISHETDLVLHAGAMVNLVYPYSALKAANVYGTREVLRLCCEGRTKPLHYISTNGVFPPETGLCLEDADLDASLEDLEGGYEESKWVAERLVREAGSRGLPFRVYRPGNISGHSDSGASNPRDFLTAVISESVGIGAAPQVEGWRMEMTPVDFVARAILRLSELPNPSGETFHLANPSPPLASEVFEEIEVLGFPLDRLELKDWMRERSSKLHTPDLDAEDIVGGVLGTSNPDPDTLLDDNRHDDSNTKRTLGNTLQRPPLDAELLSRYLRHFVEKSSRIPTLQSLPASK